MIWFDRRNANVLIHHSSPAEAKIKSAAQLDASEFRKSDSGANVKKASVATDFNLTTTRAPEMTHLPSHGMWEGEIRYV